MKEDVLNEHKRNVERYHEICTFLKPEIMLSFRHQLAEQVSKDDGYKADEITIVYLARSPPGVLSHPNKRRVLSDLLSTWLKEEGFDVRNVSISPDEGRYLDMQIKVTFREL